MKKSFAFVLTAILCLCCLASCGSAHKENEWFSEEKLTNCLVGDLPTIEKDYVNSGDEDIYVSFTAGEREAYVVSVFEYLKSQNFKYLGTRGEQASTLAGSFTTYYFKPATELSEFYVGSSYKFVYSDGTLDECGDPIFCILTIYDYEAKNLECGTKNFAYNTLITLRYKSEAPLSGRYRVDERKHSSGDAIAMEVVVGCSPEVAANKKSNVNKWLRAVAKPTRGLLWWIVGIITSPFIIGLLILASAIYRLYLSFVRQSCVRKAKASYKENGKVIVF